MYIVILCSFIAILLTYLESIGKFNNGMKYGFILVTILGCIHYNYGNDYKNYYELFNQLCAPGLTVSSIIQGNTGIYGEAGWHLLNYLFKYLGGFFVLVAVLNIFQNWVFYRFIKDNVSVDWRVMAVFIYLCYTSLYLMNFSMMRQGLTTAIFLSIWPLIKKRDCIISILIIILISFIHKSALFLLPFAFWGYISFDKGKWVAITYIVLFITIWSSSSFISDVMNQLMTIESFEDYANTYGKDEFTATFGLGFILKTIPFFIALYYLYTDEYDEDSDRALCAIGIVGFMLTPFSMVIPTMGRFGIYFTAYSIAAIPICYRAISNYLVKQLFVGLYVLSTAYDYFIFFSNPTWIDNYTEFHTFFEVL